MTSNGCNANRLQLKPFCSLCNSIRWQLRQVLQSTVELGDAMAGATEHQVTIAFVNLGLVEAALTGKNAWRHLEDIERLVNELFERHSIKILCMVEVGQLKIGLAWHQKTL